jgi:hypothetical protein
MGQRSAGLPAALARAFATEAPMNELWPWLSLALLGAFHGLNPGMGWLFAVALGLQERSRTAVYGAFAPIALGHMLSIAVVVVLVTLAQNAITPGVLRLASAAVLMLFGLYKLARAAHPRWVGMRVNFGDLTAWSFLMASAHGAGLMLTPILLELPPAAAVSGHAAHAGHLLAAGAAPALPYAETAAVVLHTLAMFAAMAAVAVLVYEKLGTSILRRAWLNLDRLWAFALVGVGLLTLVL